MQMPEPTEPRSNPSPLSVDASDQSFWMGFALFNELPHIELFDSFAHLAVILYSFLLNPDWARVLELRRREMAATNARRKHESAELWRMLLNRMTTAWTAHGKSLELRSFDSVMLALYGLEVPNHNTSFAVARDLKTFSAASLNAVLARHPSKTDMHIAMDVDVGQDHSGELRIAQFNLTLYNINPSWGWVTRHGVLSFSLASFNATHTKAWRTNAVWIRDLERATDSDGCTWLKVCPNREHWRRRFGPLRMLYDDSIEIMVFSVSAHSCPEMLGPRTNTGPPGGISTADVRERCTVLANSAGTHINVF